MESRSFNGLITGIRKRSSALVSIVIMRLNGIVERADLSFIKLRWRLAKTMRKILPRPKAVQQKVEFDFKGVRRVDMRLLKPGETLVVRTENSLYQIVVAPSGPPDAVAYAESRHFPEPRKVRLNGSVVNPDGSSIYAGLLIRGLHMELGVGDRNRICTSVIKHIAISGLNVTDELAARALHTDPKTGVLTRH